MIKIAHLRKEYRGDSIVSDLSFTVKKGSVFGFLGPNGAGKTTTIKMLVGLSAPTSGSISIDGKSPRESAVRAHIGFMPETPSFYRHLTGFEFIEYCGELSNRRNFTQVDYRHSLEEVGLSEAHDLPIRNYSKGMKQRLAFAQAILGEPDYIFLDEPLDGLDPIGRRELKRIIQQLKNKGKTIFFNSHILFDTEELCNEIGIIHRGALLYKGDVKQFCGNVTLEEKFVATIEALQMKEKK